MANKNASFLFDFHNTEKVLYERHSEKFNCIVYVFLSRIFMREINFAPTSTDMPVRENL